METVSCALCGADRTETVLALRDFSFNIPGDFPLVRCARCGLMYLNPRPTASEMLRYYPPSYQPYKYAIEDERWALLRWVRRRNIRKYRRVVETFSPHVPGRILDVGCSTGIFLAEMRDAGWEPSGVELGSTAAAYAGQRFGLSVFQGQLEASHFPPGHFSVATLWDVLEHTFDPMQTLHTLNEILCDGGVVVLTVPHFESWDRALFGRYWIGYDAPRHLYVFQRAVLREMLGRAGFNVVRMRCAFGGYFTTAASLRLWLNQKIVLAKLRRFFLRLINLHGVRFLVSPLDAWADWLGRGNKLEVVGRKIGSPVIGSDLDPV